MEPLPSRKQPLRGLGPLMARRRAIFRSGHARPEGPPRPLTARAGRRGSACRCVLDRAEARRRALIAGGADNGRRRARNLSCRAAHFALAPTGACRPTAAPALDGTAVAARRRLLPRAREGSLGFGLSGSLSFTPALVGARASVASRCHKFVALPSLSSTLCRTVIAGPSRLGHVR